jgi:PAS domain S-box-containing protein
LIQKLKDSELRYRRLFEAAEDGILILDAETGMIADVNPYLINMLGYSREEFVEKKLWEVGAFKDMKASKDAFEALQKNEYIRYEDLPLKTKDGQLIQVEFVSNVYLVGNERVIQCNIRDITARKQAEEKLRESEGRYRALFELSPIAVYSCDTSGLIQEFNHHAAELWGREPALGDSDERFCGSFKLFRPDGSFLPHDQSPMAQVVKGTLLNVQGEEVLIEQPNGSRVAVIVSIRSLKNQHGEVTGAINCFYDITARKQVEEELEKLAQRLRDQQFYTRSLIESNVDALMTTDPFGIITDVNKEMEALTDCTRDELIGAPFKNYFIDPDRAEAAIKLVLQKKKVTNYELTVCAREGKETVVSYNATTFYDRDRNLQGVFAAARDVTERNRLDRALLEKNVELESAKSLAEKANLAKSNFLSSMSHELRSPLNAILGFAQMLDSESPPLTPAQKSNIGQILHAGWHLLRLIDEVLDLAKIESGKVTISPEPVSLAEVMLECQSMIEPQAQKRGVNLTFSGFDMPSYVRADRTRVKQVLLNLLSNAIKYNVRQGVVEVKCAQAKLGRVRVSIEDTGAGLSPEQLAQLFQEFNRLGQESGGEEGTGIGLVVAKRLVELMGGEIGVESTVGLGSMFWFELASVAAPQLSIELGETVEPFLQPHLDLGAQLQTVLYVEDNPANMNLVEQIIARQPNLRLLTAINGNSGVELARSSEPDVILIDINLPDISGIEVMKILRSDPATLHIPIVALSANAMPRDIQKGLDAGFFRYITKPIKINEFMDALNATLEFALIKSSIGK